MDKYTGKRLDSRYEIQELIGVGGMAVVYRAYDIIDDKIVALKILKDEFLGNNDFVRRFKNESNAIAVLSHPNIVKVYDVSFGTKIQYIVMEYIDGITLKEFISRQKIINWQDAVYFAKQTLSALKHAHNKGIIHRDIKPQNIMLLKDGTIKVTDFGIARFARNETHTMTDRAIGSVHYISPEQAKGSIIDERSDIYSVGVMMYEMLTGKLPFEADNAVSVAIMQMQTKPVAPTEINQEIPKGLEQITLRAMQKNINHRYQNADNMLNELKKFEENPETIFEYEKYFADNNPTKYINNLEYENNYNYNSNDDVREHKKKSKATAIAGGIAAAVGIIAVVFVFMAWFTSCGINGVKDVEVPNFVGMKLSDVQSNINNKFEWKVEPVYDSSKPEGIILSQDPAPGSKKVKQNAVINLQVNTSGVLITVPSVKNMTEEVARAKLDNLGLKYEIVTVNHEDIIEGNVCNITPREDTKVTADTTVTLFISEGPEEKTVRIPDVTGKTIEQAKQELESAGIKVSGSIIYENSDKAKDVVLSTEPLPGVTVEKDSEIRIMASSGKKKEKNFDITIDLPDINYPVTMSVYDGNKRIIFETVNPAYGKNYSIPNGVTGTTGTKIIRVKLDDKLYREYEIDFDSSSNNIKTTKHEYKVNTQESEASEANDENQVYQD
ncbi:MAG: Stk1 family PASTA domain-containing Ser/Thr kinase [Clostridia bacterium]|nr:Stk1 family PASTA domain-containing Ser/Thr kinase [Clostridia bacterium]